MTKAQAKKNLIKAQIACDAAQRAVFLTSPRTDVKLGDLIAKGGAAVDAYKAALASLDDARFVCRQLGV